MVRFMPAAIATSALVIICLTGCSSQNGTTQASTPPRAVSASCKLQEDWKPVPGNLRASVIAKSLGVDESAITGGGYSTATCDTAVSEDAMGDPAIIPIVSVDSNPACLALGTQSAPVAGAATRDVVVICPATK